MDPVSNKAADETQSSPSPSRTITVAAAQLGPIDLTTPRSTVLDRLLALLSTAHSRHAQLIVYPELALTTFFPRYPHLISSPSSLESFFEHASDPSDPTTCPHLTPIFAKAHEYAIDVAIGYAECDTSNPAWQTDPHDPTKHTHYNTAVYYSAHLNKVISKYRKVHLPGTFEPYADPNATNQLEKRYFLPGNLGFEAFRAPGLLEGVLKQSPAHEARSTTSKPLSPSGLGQGDPILGTLICNDRRWPEAWRVYGLQGTELLLCGFNTTAYAPDLVGSHSKIQSREAAKAEALFHHKLSVQHGSYSNACWSVNVAKCGVEKDDGTKEFPLIGGTCVVDPDGEVVAEIPEGREGEDECLVVDVDLGMCRRGKGKGWAFERTRRCEAYARIVAQTGVVEPELLEG